MCALSWTLWLSACGRGAESRQPEASVEPVATVVAPIDPVPPAATPIVEAVEPPKVTEGVSAAWRPPAEDPPDVAAVKLRLVAGDSSSRMIKELQKLCGKHPQNSELPYLLGQLYFGKLWVGDGLKAFRRALSLDASLRENPFLIRAAIAGLANDGDHRQVARFLTQDIGSPAAPYVEELMYSDVRGQVKERAEAILRNLR